MATIPTQEPEFVYQGDTLAFTKSLPDYPATEGWTLTYYFVSNESAGKSFSFSATASGSDYAVSFDTTGAEVGEYRGRAKVTLAGQTYTAWTGDLTVRHGFDVETDIRSQAKRTFDNICAVLEGRASSTILESTVEGTQLKRIPAADLLLLRDRYEQLVRAEDDKLAVQAGRASRRNIYSSFTAP